VRRLPNPGLVLLAATAAALVWANSPWHHAYETAWHGWRHTAVNDGLMSVFFFVVGLEVRRHRSLAPGPVAAAVGGMVVPALLFLAVAPASARHGWGIPMATDVAFALAVLDAAGRRARALRPFLLTLAVVDDIGAVLVIALVYRPPGLPVHPTLLAVAIGLAFPPRRAGALERALTPWTTLVVLPLFALANAGVRLADTAVSRLTLAVALALAVGKPVGVVLGALAAPRTPSRPHLLGVGLVAGVGFTVSLFVADLAYDRPSQRAAAKLGVLAGSAVAAAAAGAYNRRARF
jgi:NhaA family Na+:H+ antiporter